MDPGFRYGRDWVNPDGKLAENGFAFRSAASVSDQRLVAGLLSANDGESGVSCKQSRSILQQLLGAVNLAQM
ncbi:hypothetical protein [Bradyrhizobium yuanmingense]|uniref:Uncharacterized protein n=1 Tax=Bradyrhizobium yuanmingense TaxID=108015 RepID=A0ABV4G853_9BRAD|nr:hypothetical protein [Bradyrhizobium yuanmingense]